MPTLVLSHRFAPDSNTLWAAAVARGWDVERLHRFACPPGLPTRDPVFYGETLLADAVAGDLGIALLEPTYTWLPDLARRYLQRDVERTTFRRARLVTTPRFVKPVDETWFRAAVYPNGGEIPGAAAPSDDADVLVAEPVHWGLECRAFVVDRRVAAISPYMRDGALATDDAGAWSATDDELEAARELLTELLADTTTAVPPAVVIDVGHIGGRGWAVVEANAAWASGVCGADPDAVLDVLRRASVPQAAIGADDAPWIRRVGNA